MSAGSIADVRVLLRKQALHPERIAALDDRSTKPIPPTELAPLMHGMASLLATGVSVDRAMEAMLPATRPALRAIFLQARSRLAEGASLSAALNERSGAVPTAVLAVLQAAERNGQLAQGLADAARGLDDEAALRRDLTQALAYPTMLAVVGGGAVLVLLFVVLPRFTALLADAQVGAPLLTRTLLLVADAASHPLTVGLGLLLPLVLVAACTWFRSELDEQLLALPLIGRTRHAFITARSTQGFAAALAAGTSVLGALDAARDAALGTAIVPRLDRVRRRVSEGEPLAASLQREEAWSAYVMPVIAIGEANGTLRSMSERASAMSRNEGLASMQSATRLIEPVLVLLFGGLVALVAAGMLQAVYALRPS